MSTIRHVERLINGLPTSDGAGVKLTRVLTQDLQQRLDPFLMLDVFASDNPDDYISGFPSHPHRGFETVTYMLHGRMRHKDSTGNEGLLEPGGAQWMTAGRGLIHSELPEQEEGRMEGFQLWVNLPAKNKMIAPFYKDLSRDSIPEVALADGGVVRIVAGQYQNTKGAIQRPDTDPQYLDVVLAPNQVFEHALPAVMNAFIYVYQGSVLIDGQVVNSKKMAILSNTADALCVQNTTSESRFLLIAGYPLNESIVQYGPFVMNTRQEIQQAVEDYHQGKFNERVRAE